MTENEDIERKLREALKQYETLHVTDEYSKVTPDQLRHINMYKEKPV